jgi:carboxylesterase type B
VFTASIDDLAKAKLFKNCNIIAGFEEAEFGYFITLALTVDQARNIDKTTFYSLLDNLRLPDNTKVEKNNVISAYFNGTSIDNLNQTSLEYLDALIQIVSDLIFVCPNFELAEIYTSVERKAYVYEHDYRISTSKIHPIFGVVHTDEIPFIFGEAISNKVRNNII